LPDIFDAINTMRVKYEAGLFHPVGLSLLGSLVVMALNSRLDGREFNSRPLRLVLGWVTVFGRANHLSISPNYRGQLSLLPYVGPEMSTGQSAVTFCRWVVNWEGSLHLWINVWVSEHTVWQVKLCDPSLTRAIPERFGNE